MPDPNGLAFSPDYRQALRHEHGEGARRHRAGGGDVFVFDVGGDNERSISRLFTDCVINGVKCGPDGVRTDVTGNIWISSNAGRNVGYSGVTVWAPDGR